MQEFCMIYRHEDGTASYWLVDLPDESYEQVVDALEPCAHLGISCRGMLDNVLEDLKERFKE